MSADDFNRERFATFLIVELHNLNAEWIRRYYVSVSMNTALRKNGKRIIIGRKHLSVADAISYAIEKVNGSDAKLRWMRNPNRFLEPSWNAVNTLPQLANFLNFPDKNAISTSIAAARDMSSSLRAARNYYAHRCVDTRKAFWNELEDRFGWAALRSPSIEILDRRMGSSSNLFSFWLDESARINREVCDA
jgi:hypothetical protein